MKVQQLRECFLKFFTDRDHIVVRSSPLIPERDPTLFFTNAGMVQFKNVFTGEEKRPYSRATSVQKCMRVSGKHNDLENVGHTPRHHTFFEMLGNFSFGDYFKEEALEYSWSFLVDTLGLPAERLLATVYEQDDEAFDLWKRYLPVERIARCGKRDNYWSMGSVGPNGPCAEIHWDLGEVFTPDNEPDPWGYGHDAGRYMEIWNLVFMQYFTDAAGTTSSLPRPCVDTGMGLERLAAVLQGAPTNYETDEFARLLARAADIAGLEEGVQGDPRMSLKVLADHGRASAFLLADGVMPSNVERGYVLRRVMRRAIRHGVKLGIERPFLHEIADETVSAMGDAYPELVKWREKIVRFTRAEEETFRKTLHNGLERLDTAFAGLVRQGGDTVPGDVVFVLHSQDGFPPDLTGVIAGERGFSIDEAGYAQAMEKHRAISGGMSGSGNPSAPGTGSGFGGLVTTFDGFEATEKEVTVLAIRLGDERIEEASEGDDVEIVVDVTPFYAERGGQVGDSGTATSRDGLVEVSDTVLDGEAFVHVGRVARGSVSVGDLVRLAVHETKRDDIRRNHTATHLLHSALRDVLGEHVAQQGSRVAPDRLRFDFSHFQAVTAAQLDAVETRVNEDIRKNSPVVTLETSYDEAVARGAMALFGEKYGDQVRMVEVRGTSVELCGGTHCARTGDVGLFKIISEGSVAQGVRRIEALTGHGTETYVRELESMRDGVASLVRAQPSEIPDRVARLVSDRRQLMKQIEELTVRLASDGGGTSLEPVDVAGVKLIAAEIEADAKVMREQADRLMETLQSGIVALGARDEASARLVIKVSRDLTDRFHAGRIIGEVAALVGGKGGGRPDMAQAGGKDPAGLADALERVRALIAET